LVGEVPVREHATRWPLRRIASSIFLCLSMAASDLLAAPNDAAPPAAPPKDGAAVGLADWRLQMADRINRSKTFPADAYCLEGIVKISFLIDRSGNLLSSEIAESSNIPAFDVEALAILKRAHPFPPPPEGVGGAFVTLNVPVRFKRASRGDDGERLLHLDLRSDSTLMLDGALVQSKELDRAINSATNNDKNARVIICSDENVQPEQLSNLAEHVKAAGFKFTLVPRPTAKSD
jgi:TonB family protein